MTPTLLAVFAHPDDETFLGGPLLAKHAAEGARVELVCGTPPEAGEYAQFRRQCLLGAAADLGIQAVHFLGYEASPMRPLPGLADGDYGNLLSAAPLEEVARRVAAVMREVRPDVVVTDSPYGAYGHPDHIVMHRAAVAAFGDYANPQARLYCLAFPLPLVRLNVKLMALLGQHPHRLGARGDINLAAIVKDAPRKTAVIDARPYVAARRAAALRRYADEIAAAPPPLKLLETMPLWAQRLIFGRVALTRLAPPPGEALERELFPREGPASTSL